MSEPGPISRRSFMHASLAAGAAASIPALASSAPTARTPKRKWISKALKVGMIGVEGSLTDKFKAAKNAGFAGVEIDSPGPYSSDEVLRAIDASGIQVPGVVLSTHWSKPFNSANEKVREEADEALAKAMVQCAEVGGETVLVVPAVVNQGNSYAEAYRRSQEAMRRSLSVETSKPVTICFENVWNNFLLSPIEAARYCDELNPEGSTPFGWYFDIGNIVNYGWPEHWIETLGPRIRRLDVKDYSRSLRNDQGLWKGFNVKIGDGDAGWDRVRAALKKIEYTGWATAEVGGGGPERLLDISNRMDRVFEL